MLKIENASIAFDKEVLFTGLNAEVAPGELVCITGESGKGKTSLLKSIMGFVPLQTGSIRVGQLLLTPGTVDEIRRQIAWMPQELALPAEWVSGMVRTPFELKANKKVTFSKECLMHYFEMLGLEEELYDKRVSEISGGQRQRIMLAVSAMLCRPLLMVDEPTSALDGVSVDRVLDFFRLLKSGQTAILAVSHDKKFVEGCDRKIRI